MDELEIATVRVTSVHAQAVRRLPIPAGIVGAQVRILYDDPMWAGMHKTVVFKGAVTKDVITDAEVVTIPAEVVARPGVLLMVGIYGVDADGNLAIPTLWADLGTIRDGADPSGDATTDPSLPVWAQIQTMIGNLEDLDTTAKNNLVAAVNEAMAKGGGTVDEADVRRIVEEYLASNPPAPGEPGKDGADGKDGATPNIQIGTVETLAAGSPATASMGGTPENPLLNLGIPQGAPGSGGSGISVTGAMVGQTVRIAAVDENGVPTAWEPVDLPSGGGKWRKIADLITTEDVKGILISQDMNGKPFALKDVRIATCARAVDIGTGYDYCRMEVNGSSIIVGQNNGINTKLYYRYAYYSVTTDGTGFGWFASTNLPMGANPIFNSLSCVAGGSGLVEKNHGFPITSVGFSHIAATGLIATGAEMVVYGIDA